MTSSRLPGKILMAAAGKPLLGHHLDRLAACRRLDGVVVATTTNAADEPVAALAARLGVPVFRGSEPDVLGRFAGAAAAHGADVVVRVTSDCPLIDPALIDALIELYLSGTPPADYAHLDVTTFPRGLDAEVFSRAVLDEAAARAGEPAEREHVTPYVYRRPERFRIVSLRCDRDLSRHRWCVDEPVDLELVRRLLAVLPPGFGWQDVCKALDDHPEWIEINRAVAQKGLGS